MLERSWRFARTRPLLATIWLATALAAGWSLGRLYCVATNTLAANGRWVVTKTTLAEPVMGAFSYERGLQALSGGVLNLGAWHGYQEVLLSRPVRPASIAFDFLLQKNAYLVLVFDKAPGRGQAGLRLSRPRGLPSMLFTASDEGAFGRRRLLAAGGRRLRPSLGVWHRALLELGNGTARVSVDGRAAGSLRLPLLDAQIVGFRGGRKNAYVDNVVIRQRQGPELKESFDAPRGGGRVTAGAMAASLLAGLLLLETGQRRGLQSTHLAFTAIMVALTSSAVSWTFHAYVRRHSRVYPAASTALLAAEHAGLEQAVEDLEQRVHRRYGRDPAPGTLRILFVGSSQTVGSGATQPDETMPAVVESLLGGMAPPGRRVECINVGVASARAQLLLHLYRRWVHLSPHLVVVDLSNNDHDRGAFGRAIEGFLRLSRKRGIPIVLVEEPNSREWADRNLRANHAVLERLGEEWDVPVVDLPELLGPHRDAGFLWWDKVHMTSLGYRLAGLALARELAPLLPWDAVTAPEPPTTSRSGVAVH